MNHPTQNAANQIIILDVIRESWTLVRGLKWITFLIAFIIPSAYLLLATVSLFILPKNAITVISLPLFFICLCLITFLLLWSCIAMLSLFGVRHAIGLPINLKLIYRQCIKAKERLLYLFLIWISITLAYYILNHHLLPGGTLGKLLGVVLYLISFYFKYPLIVFAIPLLITKQCDMSTALEQSYQAMNCHWLSIIACYLSMAFIVIISAIPFGIGLIWTLPMYVAMTGIIFRETFGLTNKALTRDIKA